MPTVHKIRFNNITEHNIQGKSAISWMKSCRGGKTTKIRKLAQRNHIKQSLKTIVEIIKTEWLINNQQELQNHCMSYNDQLIKQ